jgi:hypothetical protein
MRDNVHDWHARNLFMIEKETADQGIGIDGELAVYLNAVPSEPIDEY